MTGAATDGPANRPLWSLARQRLRAERSMFLRTTATALVLALLGVATAASSVLATTAVVRDDPGAGWLVLLAAAAATALGALSWNDSWLAHLLAYRVIDAIRLDVHAALAALAPLGLGRRRSGETASAAMADAETLEWFYAHTAAQLVAGAAASAVLSAGAVAWLGLPGLLLPLAQVLLLATVVPLRRRARRQGEELRTALSALSAETVEARQAARELVLLGRVDVHRATVRALTGRVQRIRRGHAVRAGLEQAAAEAVTALVAVTGLVALAAAVSAGTLDPGLLPVALVALLAGLAPVLLVVTALQRVGEMTAAAGRLSEILTAGDAARHRLDGPDEAGEATSGDEGLELTDVHYTYPGTDREVLRGLDLRVAPGEHVAVVGASGAGKTTLLHLLVRLLEPTAGSLRLAGLDAAAPPAAARERVTLVGQHPHVFRDTVRGNLVLAARRPDEVEDDRLLAALADAGLADVVADLPGGLDAPLAEHGATWSGGQRQRLGLARGLLRDPAVLVLDEPTANLDAETEQAFLDTVARQRDGRTTVVVSHRATTIARFDRVVLLDAGRVVADGSHAELLATEPRYAEVLAAEPRYAEVLAAEPDERPHGPDVETTERR